MSENLKRLLENLSIDASLASRFKSSPSDVLDEANIDDDAKIAIKNGDINRLRSMIGPDSTAASWVYVVVYVREPK